VAPAEAIRLVRGVRKGAIETSAQQLYVQARAMPPRLVDILEGGAYGGSTRLVRG